jgi:hypothetical protein
VLRFATDFDLPSHNNQGDRDIGLRQLFEGMVWLPGET